MKVTQCAMCAHLKVNPITYAYTCPAFPNGIPREVVFDEILHNHVLPGQEGKTVFESDDFFKKFHKKSGRIKES